MHIKKIISSGRVLALAAACVWSVGAFADNTAQQGTNSAEPVVVDNATAPVNPAPSADAAATGNAAGDQYSSPLDKYLQTQKASVNLPNVPAATNNGLVSLDFQDADIRSVLKVLAFKSGVNIVAAPDVTGVINIELKDVPWQKALGVILSTYGYGFDRKDNIITVMTVENLKKYREDAQSLENQEPLVSKTFPLAFAHAEDVMKIVDKLISKRGFMNFDQRTNSIIVRDLESNVDLMAGVIKSIDTVTPQVMIEVKVIETKLTANESMGIKWTTTPSITGATRPTTFPFTNGQPGSSLFGAGGNGSFTPAQTSFASSYGAPTSSNSTFTYGSLNASQLSAMLDMLSNRTDTKILASPRLVTLDNQKASFNIAENYPVVNYSFNASTGQQQATGFTPLPIGTVLIVTPHVNNARLVTLDVHPTYSTKNPPVTEDNDSFPDTQSRDVQTSVMVEDGKTLVIGGLIQSETDVSKYKVPFLGDIPMLGSLFRTTETTKTRDEVIVFITPHIITIGKEDAFVPAVQ